MSEQQSKPEDPPTDLPPSYQESLTNQDRTLEQGPLRPFQQPVQPAILPPSNLPAPQFPFWNGAFLTPEQTGFSHGPSGPLAGGGYTSTGVWGGNGGYKPSLGPVPGQPLLNQGKFLVYPSSGSSICHKCGNTGYKNYDPSHPCTRDWAKYGKPYQGALKIAIEGLGDNPPPSHYQRPLPNFNQSVTSNTPSTGNQTQTRYAANSGGYPGASRMNQQYQSGTRGMAMTSFGPGSYVSQGYTYTFNPVANNQPAQLVVRPGDPRIGGVLCGGCGGKGRVDTGFFNMFIGDEICPNCRGAGRIF